MATSLQWLSFPPTRQCDVIWFSQAIYWLARTRARLPARRPLQARLRLGAMRSDRSSRASTMRAAATRRWATPVPSSTKEKPWKLRMLSTEPAAAHECDSIALSPPASAPAWRSRPAALQQRRAQIRRARSCITVCYTCATDFRGVWWAAQTR